MDTDSLANILSFALLTDQCVIRYDSSISGGFSCYIRGKEIKFRKNKEGLYVTPILDELEEGTNKRRKTNEDEMKRSGSTHITVCKKVSMDIRKAPFPLRPRHGLGDIIIRIDRLWVNEMRFITSVGYPMRY